MENQIKDILLNDYSVTFDRFSNTYTSLLKSKTLIEWGEINENCPFGTKDIKNTPFFSKNGPSDYTKIEFSFSYSFKNDHFVWMFIISHIGYKNYHLSEDSQFRFLIDEKIYPLTVLTSDKQELENTVMFVADTNNLEFTKALIFGKRIEFSFKYSSIKNDLLLEDILTNENLSFLELRKILLLQICLREKDKVESTNIQLIYELSSLIEEKKIQQKKVEAEYYGDRLNKMEKKTNLIGFYLKKIFG